jgi:hypothetical protein
MLIMGFFYLSLDFWFSTFFKFVGITWKDFVTRSNSLFALNKKEGYFSSSLMTFLNCTDGLPSSPRLGFLSVGVSFWGEIFERSCSSEWSCSFGIWLDFVSCWFSLLTPNRLKAMSFSLILRNLSEGLF